MTTHSSILACEILDREAWWATVHGAAIELDTTQRLNNNKQYATKKNSGSLRKFKKYPETNESKKHNNQKTMECSKSRSKKEVYSNIILPQEIRKTSNKQPKLTPKANRERTNKAQSQQVGKNHKHQSRNKDKTIAKVNETKSQFFEKIKLINLQPESSRNKGRGPKSIKLEMKKKIQ